MSWLPKRDKLDPVQVLEGWWHDLPVIVQGTKRGDGGNYIDCKLLQLRIVVFAVGTVFANSSVSAASDGPAWQTKGNER